MKIRTSFVSNSSSSSFVLLTTKQNWDKAVATTTPKNQKAIENFGKTTDQWNDGKFIQELNLFGQKLVFVHAYNGNAEDAMPRIEIDENEHFNELLKKLIKQIPKTERFLWKQSF